LHKPEFPWIFSVCVFPNYITTRMVLQCAQDPGQGLLHSRKTGKRLAL
jgi:hypothetical protein